MGSSIVYSERTNEELEELFRIVIDDEFLRVCQREKSTKDDLLSFVLSTNQCNYEDISSIENQNQLNSHVVHEINVSVRYDVYIDRNNSNLQLLRTYFNVIPEENENSTKRNRFSNLNLSNDIDRFVRMHDYVHHSQRSNTKTNRPELNPNRKPQQPSTNDKRRTTILTTNENEEFDSDTLAQIVEQQLEAARRAAVMKNFNPTENLSIRKQQINRAEFIPPTKLITESTEERFSHHVDYVQFPRTILYPPLHRPFISNNDKTMSPPFPSRIEREKLFSIDQQGPISSSIGPAYQKTPSNIQSVPLLKVPHRIKTDHLHQNFRYERMNNNSGCALRRAKSMKHMSRQAESLNQCSSDIIGDPVVLHNFPKFAAPLKNIKFDMYNKYEAAMNNKRVSKEKCQGRKIVEM